MVQTKARRRSSLIMGILLALLLGVAAAFFVLAMPIRMLETVTTVTRLSKLMVQAEPPISPNDRTLLSVLAGILTAGIGWVLVDWLVFGRAGMSTLIRTREDDYEDEDEDHFRPTDPLDLVTPVAAATPDWTMPSSGDARRPLSARTDIGDPPPASAVPDPFGSGLAGINQALPPINDILPGAGVSAPPLQPNAHPGALPPLVQPGGFPPMPAPALQIEPGAGMPASWPPLDTPQPLAFAPEAPQPQSAEPAPALRATLDGPPLAGLPSWMPAPGARPDGQPGDELPSAFYEDPAEPTVPEAEPVPLPEPIIPAMEEPAPVPVPPLLTPQDPFAPPPLSDVPPLAVQAFDPVPPPQDVVPPPFEVAPSMPTAVEPVAPPAVEPAPIVAPQPPVQPAAPVAAAPAASLRPLPEPVIDRVRLEELLGRLEKGLERRRAAAAAVQAAQVQPAPPQPAPPQPVAVQPAPVVQPVPATPVPVEPAQVAPAPMPTPAALPESIIPIAPAVTAPLIPQPPTPPAAPEAARAMPPSAFAAPPPFVDASILPLPVAANETPLSAASQMPPAPAEASILPVAAPSGVPDGQNDQLLDQPLHVTLDLLRSMVKR